MGESTDVTDIAKGVIFSGIVSNFTIVKKIACTVALKHPTRD